MWFDSHCHLYDLDDPQRAVAAAREAGIGGILILGVDAPSSDKALAMADGKTTWAGAAVHPSATKGWQPGWIAPIERLLSESRVVAVGESGLDHHWDTSFNDDQEEAFRAHIELAKKHSKPLVIHTRASVGAALMVLQDAGPPSRSIFHCWSGTVDEMLSAVELGAYISFAGNLTFKRNDGLRAVAAEVPAERLLVETDSPYLTPEPHRGTRNQPANVVHVGAALALARDVHVDELANLTTQNARRAFGMLT